MLAVFPVATTARGGAPTYGDDYNPQGLNGGRKHEGIDIFAAEGTPLYAVADGTIRMSEEKYGGHVVYLASKVGTTTYLYAHLSAYEGAARAVVAGDVIGYVGRTGNAKGTSPHCHFEIHPTANHDTIDPYPLLQAAGRQVAASSPAGAPKVARQSVSLSLGAKALSAAYEAKHNATAPTSALLFPLEQAIGEGTFGPTYVGSNNWGSMHATASFERDFGQDFGFGMLAVLDSNPSTYYIARLAIYPTPLHGALAFLMRVESAVGDLTAVTSVSDYAAKLYATGYYQGQHPDVTPIKNRSLALQTASWTQDDEANIADYAALLARQEGAASAALDAMASETGDPLAVTVGPPFAKLAHRLTPGREPHTLEHARELLGRAAVDPPAGAISLADALNAPGGEGVWMFASADLPQPSTPPKTVPSTTTTPTNSSSSSASAPSGLGRFVAIAGVLTLTALTAAAAVPELRRRVYG